MSMIDLRDTGSAVPTILRVPARPKINAGPLPTHSTRPSTARDTYPVTTRAAGRTTPKTGSKSSGDTRPARRSTRPQSSPKPFFSGFCNPHGCKDTRGYCMGFVRNGSDAPVPVLTCACTCHTPGGTGTPTA